MRTSKVVVYFDYEKLDKRYQIVKVRSDAGRIDKGSCFLDAGQLSGEVVAVSYVKGNGTLYVLLSSSLNAVALMRNVIERTGETDLSFERVRTCKAVPQRVLLTLLLNALATSRFSTCKASNIGGKLILLNARHREMGGAMVHGLSVGVSGGEDNDLYLTLRVVTFSKLCRFPRELRNKYAYLPRYTIVDNVFMRRLGVGTEGDVYVQRSLGRSKYTYTFLDIANEAKFEASKLGILSDVLRRFSIRYGDAARMRFEELEGEETRRELSLSNKTSWRSNVARALGDSMCVVDATGTSDFARARIVSTIERLYQGAITIREEPTCTYCLKLIHDAATYAEGWDPHNDERGTAITQHVVADGIGRQTSDGLVEALVDACIKELVIKRDVQEERLSLLDWDALGVGSPWTFGIRANDDDALPTFAFVEVGKGGALSFSLEGDLLGFQHMDLVGALSLYDADYVIRDPAGNVNVITKRELFTLPDVTAMSDAFEAKHVTKGGSLRRTKETKTTLFADVLDAVFVTTGKGRGYYRVGEASSNMGTSVVRSSVLREVRAVSDAKLLFPDALCLLDVDFVRLRRATVLPFPIKYLREWILANS